MNDSSVLMAVCLVACVSGCCTREARVAPAPLPPFEIVCKPRLHMEGYGDPSGLNEAYVEAYGVILTMPDGQRQFLMLPQEVTQRIDTNTTYQFVVRPGQLKCSDCARVSQSLNSYHIRPEILEIRHKDRVVYQREKTDAEHAVPADGQ
jgi:hypothetical protein